MRIGEENERIEFKKSTGERKEAMSSISGMLNKHGFGTIYFGVDDMGNVIGQQVSDSTIRDISRIIFEYIEPKISSTIEVATIEGKTIIKVTFSGSNKPYSSGGVFYMRVGTENRRMSVDELRSLFKSDDYASKWEISPSGKTLEDIDEMALKEFYRNATKCGRIALSSYDEKGLLSSLDLIRGEELSNGGYALFGKNARIKLKLALYATDEKLTFLDLKQLDGNIYNLVNSAIEYIESKINWKAEIGTRQRIETPEIPLKAIREMVVNAFAHANYEADPEIEINIHPGKIVIYNNGAFPEGLTPDDFIKDDISSFKRNPLILDVLFRSKDVEKSGTGFKRMAALCKEAGVKWSYEKKAHGFYFVFLRNGSPNTTDIAKDNGDLTLDESEVVEFISSHEKASKADIAAKIGKSEKTAQRVLASLLSKSFIVRIGSNKSGHWEVIKNRH